VLIPDTCTGHLSAASDKAWHVMLVVFRPTPAKLLPVSMANRDLPGQERIAFRRPGDVDRRRNNQRPKLSNHPLRDAAINSASALGPLLCCDFGHQWPAQPRLVLANRFGACSKVFLHFAL